MSRQAAWAAFSLLSHFSSSTQPGCEGVYKEPVKNLCPENWPTKDPRKNQGVWLVLFHAPWCGHCEDFAQDYSDLGGHLVSSGEPVSLGAVDCSQEPNQAICREHEIAGYPTLYALLRGEKPREYTGARDIDSLKSWVLSVVWKQKSTRGGSKVCAKGLFSHKATSSVVPLCEAHFPSSEGRHAWVVVFYDRVTSKGTNLREVLSKASSSLGNALESSASGRAGTSRITQRERIKDLGKRHGLELRLPLSGPSETGPLAKVGAVCCDCAGPAEQDSCRERLWVRGAGDSPRPVAVLVNSPRSCSPLKAPLTVRGLVAMALEGLGFLAQREAEL